MQERQTLQPRKGLFLSSSPLFMDHTASKTGTPSMSATADKTAGRWDQFVGRVRQVYGNTVGDDVQRFKGNMQEARGWLKEQYGEVKEELAEFFD
jgi:uncharacterized protein YjbJ (UPF0337 family)